MKFLPSYPESKLQQWKENLVEGVARSFTRGKGNPEEIDVKIGNCSRETERKLKRWKGIEKNKESKSRENGL